MKKLAYLVMLHASYTREMGYAFEKELNIVVRRKMAVMSINFSFTTNLL